MSLLLQYFILVPLIGFLASLLVPRKNEKLLSGMAIGIVAVQLAGVAAFIASWLLAGFTPLDIKQVVLYKSPGFEFFIDFYFDATTAVFALVGAILTLLVAVFSKYYLHREQGFKRFFNTLLLFFAGYNLIVFAGNFETLFIGWEILGITSFLLIAFYRDRYLPVKNGYKVLSFYRLGDICLILAMWMSHHLWHKNITFSEIANNQAAITGLYDDHYLAAMFIAAMIIIAAAIKSAQQPFSTWLPRAMEGPTSSSAIFYGSLSVHIGVFLLIRTSDFWSHEPALQWFIGAIGLITSLLSSVIARVQSSVKTQIAYASSAQIGLMFIAVALGWHTLALVHFAGNAFLRTYQLLVSPSVLGYRIHDMFFSFTPREAQNPRGIWQKLQQAVYVLSIKEWNLDHLLHRFLWKPFKWVGVQLAFLGRGWGIGVLLAILVIGGWGLGQRDTPGNWVPEAFAMLSVLVVLKAFAERGDGRRAWLMALCSQFFASLSFLWNKDIEVQHVAFYLSGTLLAGASGYICLTLLQHKEHDLSLTQHQGHSYEYPGLALAFFLSCLGLSGFPITPTFIGIDMMFTHIDAHQGWMVLCMALNFLFLELTILRIYTRLFLGQHKKAYHPIAFKSS
jgi:NADH-quinone oxidoreductase subunit L